MVYIYTINLSISFNDPIYEVWVIMLDLLRHRSCSVFRKLKEIVYAKVYLQI